MRPGVPLPVNWAVSWVPDWLVEAACPVATACTTDADRPVDTDWKIDAACPVDGLDWVEEDWVEDDCVAEPDGLNTVPDFVGPEFVGDVARVGATGAAVRDCSAWRQASGKRDEVESIAIPASCRESVDERLPKDGAARPNGKLPRPYGRGVSKATLDELLVRLTGTG